MSKTLIQEGLKALLEDIGPKTSKQSIRPYMKNAVRGLREQQGLNPFSLVNYRDTRDAFDSGEGLRWTDNIDYIELDNPESPTAYKTRYYSSPYYRDVYDNEPNDRKGYNIFNRSEVDKKALERKPGLEIWGRGSVENLTGTPRSLATGPFSSGMSDARNIQAKFGTRNPIDSNLSNIKDRILDTIGHGRDGRIQDSRPFRKVLGK